MVTLAQWESILLATPYIAHIIRFTDAGESNVHYKPYKTPF
jgi:hypothetical protein